MSVFLMTSFHKEIVRYCIHNQNTVIKLILTAYIFNGRKIDTKVLLLKLIGIHLTVFVGF